MKQEAFYAWLTPELETIFRAIPFETRNWLDVGCGSGTLGALARVSRRIDFSVGLDVWSDYLRFCKDRNLYDKVIKWNLNFGLPNFDRHFDVATCIDVVEHLKKNAGNRLLSELVDIADVVIVTTPNVFCKNDCPDGNTFQTHLSVWEKKDFVRLGFTVYGFGFFKIFNREVKKLSFLLSPICRIPKFSQHATRLFAVYDRHGIVKL